MASSARRGHPQLWGGSHSQLMTQTLGLWPGSHTHSPRRLPQPFPRPGHPRWDPGQTLARSAAWGGVLPVPSPLGAGSG